MESMKTINIVTKLIIIQMVSLNDEMRKIPK